MTDDRNALRAWLTLLSATSAIKKSVDARMRQRFGLSISRFDVLAALDRAGEHGATAGALSARLRVTEGNTTQVTAPLIADGLVSRNVSSSDGRVAIFRLTKKGRRVFDDMAEANSRWVAESFSALTPAETTTLLQLLKTLNQPSEQSEKEAA